MAPTDPALTQLTSLPDPGGCRSCGQLWAELRTAEQQRDQARAELAAVRGGAVKAPPPPAVAPPPAIHDLLPAVAGIEQTAEALGLTGLVVALRVLRAAVWADRFEGDGGLVEAVEDWARKERCRPSPP